MGASEKRVPQVVRATYEHHERRGGGSYRPPLELQILSDVRS